MAGSAAKDESACVSIRARYPTCGVPEGVSTGTAVAVPAFVAERTGIIGALSRSFELTEGQRWRIFALMVLAFIAMMIAGLIIGMLSFGAMAGSQSYESFASFSLWSALLNAILAMAAGVVGAVGVSVLYVHLRDLKEGTSLESIGDVFR